MTEATLLLLTSGSLFLPFCLAQILPPSHEDECGADDWLRLSSGHWMPRIGLGTAGLTEPDLVARVVADALDVGYRLIDTADLYENHRQIASALNLTLPRLGLHRNQSFSNSSFVTMCVWIPGRTFSLQRSFVRLTWVGHDADMLSPDFSTSSAPTTLTFFSFMPLMSPLS